MSDVENKEKYDLNIRLAERAHDEHYKYFNLNSEHIISFSHAAMRAPALASAAGIAAMLGFYSANYKILSKDIENLIHFNNVLYWLLIGIFLSILSPVLAYISQNAFTYSTSIKKLDYNYPFIHENRKTKIFWALGEITRFMCGVSIAGSILCLVYGGHSFLAMINPLNSSLNGIITTP